MEKRNTIELTDKVNDWIVDTIKDINNQENINVR
jgi:hypothetical protein